MIKYNLLKYINIKDNRLIEILVTTNKFKKIEINKQNTLKIKTFVFFFNP